MKNKNKVLLFVILFLNFSCSLFAQSWKELDSIATEYYNNGNLEKSFIVFEKSLKQAEKEFGKKHKNYATSLDNLGVIYDEMGQYDKAEQFYKEGLKLRKEVLGEKNPDYATSLSNLGLLYKIMGKFDKAEPLLIESAKIFKEIYGEKNSDYGISLNNLGALYDNMGQYEKAEQLYKESMEIDREARGEKHPGYATSLGNLAGLYKKMGQYDKAEQLYKKALTIKKEALGEMNPGYAVSLNNMAALYDDMGQYVKAELLYNEALKINKEVLGEKHPDYANSLNNLAVLYYHIGQYEKAEGLYKESMKIWREIFGEKHLQYAVSINNLAALYDDMGQYEKAEPLYKEALKIRKEILGEKHPDYAVSLNNLADLYFGMEQFDKAELLYKETLKTRKEVLGDKHPLYAETLNNLAGLYKAIKQYDKAEALYKESVKILKDVYGERHPDLAAILNGLERTYRDMEDYDKAEPIVSEANENYLNQLKMYYPALSEKEKVNFLKTIETNFESFYSFGVKRVADNVNITKDIFDLRINTKGLILSSTSNVRKRINESNDIELNEKYSKLLSLRTKIGKAYTLSLDEQKKKGINLSELEASANELEKDISLKSEDFKSEVESRVIKYKDIRDCLKKNEAAVEFLDFKYYDKRWTDTTYYFALIIKPGLENPLFIKLCTLDELKDYLTGSSESKNSYVRNEEKSSGLYNLLWKPFEEHLTGIENLYISPSGILNKVSFASLRPDEQTLLIDKYKIRYVGNLKDIVLKKDSETEKKVLTASVFGGVKYDIDSAEMINNSMKYKKADEIAQYNPEVKTILREETERGGWGYLNGTLAEAEKIKGILEKSGYGVKEYLNEEGSEEAFKSLSGKESPGILHITTHGFFNPAPNGKYQNNNIKESRGIYKSSDNPLFRSGLILAGANRVWKGGQEIEGIENGILTAYEVSNMDLQNTELVVLSACETGLGDIKGGEGVYGLQRAFKVAGAKSIIMSLWKVPDKETVELMELFYTNWLEKKMTKHDAFSSAQMEMRKKYPPYYWAAFVMVE